jgi:hypothetical protein
MNDQPITLTLPLINGILQYLGTRPYGEVFQLVQAIQEQAAPQVKQPEPEPSQAAELAEAA